MHDVISTHLWQLAKQFGQETQCAQSSMFALEVNVSSVLFPEVSVAGNDTFVSKASKSFGKCSMDIGVFSEKQYFHK